MRYVKWALLVYLLIKPYYIFNSGALQFADIVLLTAFVAFFILCRLDSSLNLQVKAIIKQNKDFIIFVTLAFLVNLVYFLLLGQYKFILSSLYLIFSVLAIVMFGYQFRDKHFLISTLKVFKLNIVIQLLIYLLGIGRYYNELRYMGTFNDPNQFAFYIFISYLFIYVISVLNNDNKKAIYFLPLTLFLIVISGSTGMLLGISIFISLQIAYYFYDIKNNYIKFRLVSLLVMFSLLVISLIYLFTPTNGIKSALSRNTDTISQSPLVTRVNEKIYRGTDKSDISIIEERGYDKIIYYPQKIIYGAGEGAYERFKISRNNNELHATLPSILFYYGVIPFFFAARWVYGKFIISSIELKIAYIALIVESFTLLNQRQSLFWLIFMLATTASSKTRNSSSVGGHE
jgi:hypothetical protein